MANKKITDFPAGPALTGNEEFITAIGNNNYKYNLNFISTWFSGKPTAYNFGALSDDPPVSPFDGGPIPLGAQYYNTTLNAIRAFGDGGWFTPNLDAAIFALATGAQLVGTPEGTVQDALDVRPTDTVLALPGASAGLGFQQALAGSEASTIQAKLLERVSLFDFIPVAEHAAIRAGTSTYDATTDIAAALSAAKEVSAPSGTYIASELAIPPTLFAFRGLGKNGATFKHKSGATGAMWTWDNARVRDASFSGINLEGHGGVGETFGFDLSGFSYCAFSDMRARLFLGANWFANGEITPVNKQMSNNGFYDCTGNNGLSHGLHFTGTDPLRYENTANTFVCCEYSGNAGIGVNAEVCESSAWFGCTSQGNTGRDIYTNSQITFTGYVEGNPKPIELGPLSKGCDIDVRSAYPLWNTFIDNGTANRCSVRGESEAEQQIFNNVNFASWLGATPTGIALSGTPTLASYADTGSLLEAGVQVTVDANFQGFVFTLNKPVAALLGRWVTLLLDVDTSGVVDPLGTRVYSRVAAALNSATGEFAAENLPITSAGVFKRLAYDVKFVASGSGTPDIIWYIGYSGVSAGGNVVKIRSASIVMGQTRKVSAFLGTPSAMQSATATTLGAAANGVNIHRKKGGSLVYDTTAGKVRFAVAALPTSAWRATDGSGDLTPV